MHFDDFAGEGAGRDEQAGLLRQLRWEAEKAEHFRWMASLRARFGDWLMWLGGTWCVGLTVWFDRGHPHLIGVAIAVLVGWFVVIWLASGLSEHSRSLEGRPSVRVADYLEGKPDAEPVTAAQISEQGVDEQPE